MRTADDLPRLGEVLRGKYELLRTLGTGGMSVVFAGRRPENGERVAVKVLAPELAHEPEIVARFDREARAVARLRSRHVVQILDVDRTERGLPFFVMNFLEGQDLHTELERRGRLPVDEAVDYVIQACAAMDEAHGEGIVHRDLKPANLFLSEEAGQRVVTVIDFGISKVVNESAKLTGAGAVMGTIIYMSPEQVQASKDVDPRADIWSLGVILFEMLAGRVPFDGPGQAVAAAIVTDDAPDVRTFAPDTPVSLAMVIATMLRRDRGARHQSVREVVAALAPFVRPGSLGAELAAQLGTVAPTRPPGAGKTLPLHMVQKKTLPLDPRLRGAPFGAPPPAARAKTPEEVAKEAERRARAAKTIESRVRRQRSELTAVMAGSALGVVAAAIVIGVVLAVVSPSRPRATAVAATSDPATATSQAPASSAPAEPPTAPTTAPVESAPSPVSSSSSPPASAHSPRPQSREPTAPRAHNGSDAGSAAPSLPATANPTLL